MESNPQDRTIRAPLARALADAGLSVLLVDYRGYGDSGGRPSEAGTYRDARAAWDWLVGAADVPAGRIVIFGRSLGAAVAALAVVGLAVVALIVLVVAVQFLFTATDPVAILLVGITLAVAGVPEGLPAVVTFTLALGAREMVDRNALVRRLPVVESLGSVDVIVTDKTGTLTEGEMELTDAVVVSPQADGAELERVTEEYLLEVAASAERGSEHPIADAILARAAADFDLIPGEKSLGGSGLAPPVIMQRMLEFCGRHGIAPMTEVFKMDDCNEGLQHLRAGLLEVVADLHGRVEPALGALDDEGDLLPASPPLPAGCPGVSRPGSSRPRLMVAVCLLVTARVSRAAAGP